MHLLEAALALYETSGEAAFADLAEELVALFRTRLFEPADGALGEFFDAGWAPAPGPAGDHLEPGHHFEWAWLLGEYARLTGDDPAATMAALYRRGRAGTDPASGLVWDVTGRDGAVLQASTRLWPQTEALKAHVAMGRRGEADAEPALLQGLRNLPRFFSGCPLGAWIDQLDPHGRPSADKIPTSSFYHVFLAFAEVDGFVREASAPRRLRAGE